MERYNKAIELAAVFIEKTNIDLNKFKDIHKKYTEVMTDAVIDDLKNNYSGEKFKALSEDEELERKQRFEDPFKNERKAKKIFGKGGLSYMKNEKFLELMGEIDEELLERARTPKKKKYKGIWEMLDDV